MKQDTKVKNARDYPILGKAVSRQQRLELNEDQMAEIAMFHPEKAIKMMEDRLDEEPERIRGTVRLQGLIIKGNSRRMAAVTGRQAANVEELNLTEEEAKAIA